MKKIKIGLLGMAAALSIAAPQTTLSQGQTKTEAQAIQTPKQTKQNLPFAQNSPIVYTAPKRFTEGGKPGRRRQWSRGPMSLFKQKMQHKKYASKK